MSYLLYDTLASLAYGGALPVFHALQHRYGREWSERAGRLNLTPRIGTRVWVHAASVGEMTGVRPVVREILESGSSDEVVLSTTNQSKCG